MPGFVLQVAPAPENLSRSAVRVGFTVSRKVGNAVERNRVRRRLREIARLVIPTQGRTDLDYVLVGRQAALGRDFSLLQGELVEALKRVKALAPPTTIATP
jgi:ribonuclease P protein component